MILVDTSVWIDHFRSGDVELTQLLDSSLVLTHAFVVGELACGNLHNRNGLLSLLQALPKAVAVTDAEALFAIERHGLMGRGIGYVDVHLLASTLLMDSVFLWTRDKRLGVVAESLGLAWEMQ